MRFNNLVAIEKAPSRSGHTYWKFRCDCGNEKEIMKCHVVNNSIKSCGCWREDAMSIIGPTRLINSYSITREQYLRRCKICENEFIGIAGDTRVYCYECSPSGVSVAAAHKAQKRAMKHILVEYKGGECVECGYHKCEGALQFHHIDGREKDFTLSTIKPNTMSIDALRKEVDKCVLLCANCHFKKHTIDDVIGFVMHLPPVDQLVGGTKKCIVCESEFIAHHNNRRYCYSCVPYGMGIAAEKRARKRIVKTALIQYKGGSCKECGYKDAQSALQLHHRDPNEKDFTFARVNLSHLGLTMDKLKKEADKCDLLCANCHAEVHYTDDDFDLD
jgi:5-methylcytosine-specific restriction endonuclease McrA